MQHSSVALDQRQKLVVVEPVFPQKMIEPAFEKILDLQASVALEVDEGADDFEFDFPGSYQLGE